MSIADDRNCIERTVDLDAPIARVWRALTDHEEFGAWFGVRLERPFRVGETTRGHLTDPGQEQVEWVTTTERMEPQSVFAFSWAPGALDPDTEYADDARMMTEFRLESIATSTRLTIAESGFAQFPKAKCSEILRMCTLGWDAQVRNVTAHVEASR